MGLFRLSSLLALRAARSSLSEGFSLLGYRGLYKSSAGRTNSFSHFRSVCGVFDGFAAGVTGFRFGDADRARGVGDFSESDLSFFSLFSLET